MVKDIVNAIEKEKEYLAYREKGEEPYAFIDAIKEYGFDSLAEYFADKKEYLFKNANFDFKDVDTDDIMSSVFRTIQEKATRVLFCSVESTFVLCGNTKPFNEAYCKENNIPIRPIRAGGGCIVCMPGDFALAVCLPDNTSIDRAFMMKGVLNILNKYMDGVVINGNDILLHNRKIVPVACSHINGMFTCLVYFTFSDRSELIERICYTNTGVSEGEKQVGYIADMTREQLREEVAAWLTV